MTKALTDDEFKVEVLKELKALATNQTLTNACLKQVLIRLKMESMLTEVAEHVNGNSPTIPAPPFDEG